ATMRVRMNRPFRPEIVERASPRLRLELYEKPFQGQLKPRARGHAAGAGPAERSNASFGVLLRNPALRPLPKAGCSWNQSRARRRHGGFGASAAGSACHFLQLAAIIWPWPGTVWLRPMGGGR